MLFCPELSNQGQALDCSFCMFAGKFQIFFMVNNFKIIKIIYMISKRKSSLWNSAVVLSPDILIDEIRYTRSGSA